MFKIAIQGAIGGNIISRSTVIGLSQGRHRQVLRRRHFPQTQTFGKAEKGQKAHENGGQVMLPQSAFLAVAEYSKPIRTSLEETMGQTIAEKIFDATAGHPGRPTPTRHPAGRRLLP
jgi:hypothetical protein